MKALKLIATALAFSSLIAAPVTAFAGKATPAVGTCTGTNVVGTLTDSEIATLKWMREEEKLARDIYTELNAYFPARIFTNIAAAEQRHFDALGKKLVLYGIDDPALPNVGDFADPALQAMHDELLAKGMVSYVEALKVGAAIEEADVADLQVAIDGTTSVPLQRTYSHLLTGSEHHLAAFIKLLAKAGVVY
ncbi:MAG TPA: DUF2202 domain-containing protein [Steroidobacteraceae bacterium]|jgi:hypothetical protein|nr:DUF2202 domain-containing protein [Steroidobacteraceae bacterium]